MMNFKDICRKNVPNDNICHLISRLHLFSRKHNWKNQLRGGGGGVKLTLPAFLGLMKSQGFSLDIS